MMPQSVRLFHITAIDNLAAICQSGALLSKNSGVQLGINYQNIAHAGAQSSRSGRNVIDPPGGTVHDFVPFYFAPRSPMLFAINNGRVDGCTLRQADILHFETTVGAAIKGNQDFVFYDRNATLRYSEAFNDLTLLVSNIAWDLLTEPPTLDGFCKYFQNNSSNDRYADRMERRQAEFLVKHRVELSCMTRIGVMDRAIAEIVHGILDVAGIELAIDVKPDWYFLGQ